MSAMDHPTSTIARARLFAESILVFGVVLVGMIRAIHDIPIVWDEGMTYDRQAKVEEGLRRLWHGEDFGSTVDRYWRFSREEPDGHGPFYAIWSQIGAYGSGWFLDPPASRRFAGGLLFAVTVATVYWTLRQRWSAMAATTSAALIAWMPRVLPEVSTAIIDGPLLCLALLAWAAFVAAVDRKSAAATAAFGVAIGCAMATKLTGWFLWLPYLAWGLLRWDIRSIGRAAVGGLVAAAVCFLINLGWWLDPWDGLARFFSSNLTRRDTIPIPILFLGTTYSYSLPWYNTLVWTVVAVPVGTMTLGLFGVVLATVRSRSDPMALLLLLNWLLIVVLRALPQAPGHDGTRQIIISFGFLAILAGYGLDRLRCWIRDMWGPSVAALVAGLIVGMAIIESAASVSRYHPNELSYYSPVIGGLPGAEKLQFEPTYFWDAVTPDVLQWLDHNTGPDEWILFRNQTPSWKYLGEFGQLRASTDMSRLSFKTPKWFVLQHRPGMYTEADRRMLNECSPVLQKRLFGVPLLSVYTGEDWRSVWLRGQTAQNVEARP